MSLVKLGAALVAALFLAAGCGWEGFTHDETAPEFERTGPSSSIGDEPSSCLPPQVCIPGIGDDDSGDDDSGDDDSGDDDSGDDDTGECVPDCDDTVADGDGLAGSCEPDGCGGFCGDHYVIRAASDGGVVSVVWYGLPASMEATIRSGRQVAVSVDCEDLPVGVKLYPGEGSGVESHLWTEEGLPGFALWQPGPQSVTVSPAEPCDGLTGGVHLSGAYELLAVYPPPEDCQ